MYNVSFGGAKVPFNPSLTISKAKASEIAEAINIGVKQAATELGVKSLKHPHTAGKLSGALLKETNPDSFSKATGLLTDAGKKGFDKIYGKQFGVNVTSNLNALKECAKKIAKQSASDDGVIAYGFKYMA